MGRSICDLNPFGFYEPAIPADHLCHDRFSTLPVKHINEHGYVVQLNANIITKAVVHEQKIYLTVNVVLRYWFT